MALNPKLLQFFIDRLQSANYNSIAGISSQLFEHLKYEIKDNQIFNEYEVQSKSWEDWIEKQYTASETISIPGKLKEAKSLAYTVYRKLAVTDDPFSFIYVLTSQGNYKEAIYELNQMYLDYLTKSLEDILNANPEIEKGEIEKVEGDTVFIIHGHDELLKKDLQLLLNRTGVRNLVLHEQPDKGRTIIDKLVEEATNSNYAIALLSPDDVTINSTTRARQNVILEIGYFMGKLGKERVRLVVKDNVEIPSDLDGIIYEKFDSAGAWKTKLLKEIRAVGIYVDLENFIQTI